jgi:DNA-binding MarR family transcriptional regulator
MDKATIGGVVARLEAKGLVGRAIDPDDARIHRVTLTSAGRKLGRGLRPLAAEVNGRATAALSRPEAVELLNLLVRARDSLSG